MLDMERHLAERFAGLRDGRTGPVFFIEHGLPETELQDLIAAVREAMRRQPPGSDWWRIYPLPLIVSASEIGYRYRGAGTDFWPLVEEELATVVGPDDRQCIRDLFDACASRYRGARPPETPWAAAFRLIAWPITHALVPLEFHRPLAAALVGLRVNSTKADDAHMHRAIRAAAGHASVRFAAFIKEREPVVSIARALLGGGHGELSSEAITRIATDVAADHIARRDMAVAKRVQRKTGQRPASLPENRTRPPARGRLHLGKRGGKLVLEAVLPRIHDPGFDSLRRALRRRRFAPRLWGVSSRVPSEQLLSGLPFIVKLTSAPDVDAPLIPELAELGLDDDLGRLLDSFRLEFRPPLLFRVGADGDPARQVRGQDLSGHRLYWLLVEDAAAGMCAGLPCPGEIGPYDCCELDPKEARAASVLDRLGYHVHFGIAVSFAGAPPLEHDARIPRFLAGDERIIVPSRTNPESAQVELGGERARFANGLVRVRIPEGAHVLQITDEGASRDYPFEGVIGQAIDRPRPACWIEMSAPDATVQTLLSGNIAIKVDGLAPLEGLEVTIELETASHRAGTTWPLGVLPQILLGNREPWTSLLDDRTRERVLQDRLPILHVRVGTLVYESWPLEQRPRPCWWALTPSGITLQSETGSLKYGEVAATAPTAPPRPSRTENVSEARLLSPLEIDEAVFGTTATFASLCVAPDTISLEAPILDKPRFRRSRSAEGASVGIEALTEAYLRWSLAESRSWTGELRRRQVASRLGGWLTELTCGHGWAKREMQVARYIADPWTLLLDECHETGFGRDQLIELSPDDERSITRLAVAEIRRVRPELWTRTGPSRDLDDEDYDALDWACVRAYEQLSEEYRGRGREELADRLAEGDFGATPDQWNIVLDRVNARSELRELAALLLPTDTARQLMAPDLALLPLVEIREELQRWVHESRNALAGPVPAEGVLEAILALWIAPEIAITLDWRNTMNTLLIERPVARAARYLALRARAIRDADDS